MICNMRLFLNILAFTVFFAVFFAAMAVSEAGEARAIGVSTPVLTDSTIEVAEGSGPAFFTITLQNVEENDAPVRITYGSDTDIAKIIDYKEVYVLPAKSLDTKVTFNITLPESARINDVYEIRYTVAPMSAQSGGMLSVVAGISKSLKVRVSRNPDKFYLGLYLQETGKMWVVILLIVIAYAAHSIHKRKKGKHGKKLLFR